MGTKTKFLIAVAALSLVDIVIPVPILGIVLIYVLLQKPAWFRDAVWKIYDNK
jgi:hypothetical protein